MFFSLSGSCNDVGCCKNWVGYLGGCLGFFFKFFFSVHYMLWRPRKTVDCEIQYEESTLKLHFLFRIYLVIILMILLFWRKKYVYSQENLPLNSFSSITFIVYNMIQLNFRSAEIGVFVLFQMSILSRIIRRPPKYIFRASCKDLVFTDILIMIA